MWSVLNSERFIGLEKTVNIQDSPEYFDYTLTISTEDDAENAAKELRKQWGISFTAIFNRALRLGIINDYVYRNLNMDYRARKLHLNEPGTFLSKEKPEKFERLIWFALGKEIISVNDAAFYSGKSVWEFREQIHQMA